MSRAYAHEREYEPEWPEVEPLIRAAECPRPYPVEAFPPIVRDAVTSYRAYAQQPIEMIGAAALANVSLAVQALVNVARDSQLVGPTSLNICTVADSGERKSAADRAFAAAARAWQARREQEMQADVATGEARVAAYEAEREGLLQQIKRNSGGDIADLKAQLERLEREAPTVPLTPCLFYEDATPEALAQNIAFGWPSASLWSDEGGLIVGGKGMADESAMRYLALLNRLWDGNDYRRVRTTAKSFTIRGRRLTSHLMMQQVVAARLFGDDVSRGTGYLARTLFAMPESTKGTRAYREPDAASPHVRLFHDRVAEVLDTELPVEGEDMRLVPLTLYLMPAAKLDWITYHVDVEREMSRFGEFGDVTDFAAKSAENAARIAALFQVFESGLGGMVSAENMERGVSLAYWHLREAHRLVGMHATPEAERDAILLWQWIVSRGTPAIQPREVSQFGPNALRAKSRRDSTIRTLIDCGYLVPTRVNKATVFKVNPRATNGQS